MAIPITGEAGLQKHSKDAVAEVITEEPESLVPDAGGRAGLRKTPEE